MTQHLKELRLSGLAGTLAVRNQEAISADLTYLEFLELLVQDEREIRRDRRIKRGIRSAGLDAGKTLDRFDFSFNRSINRKEIFDLAAGHYLDRHENVLFFGPAGVGKSHLAQSLGHHAVLQDRRVLCRSALDVAVDMGKADTASERQDVVRYFLKPGLLIIDDFGLSPLPAAAAQYFLEILLRRYETASTIFTSNRALADFGAVLGDPTAAMAILDRFLHHAHIIKIAGRSYRLQHPGAPAAAATDLAAPEDSTPAAASTGIGTTTV